MDRRTWQATVHEGSTDHENKVWFEPGESRVLHDSPPHLLQVFAQISSFWWGPPWVPFKQKQHLATSEFRVSLSCSAFFFLFPLHLSPSVSVGWTNHSQTWLKTVTSSLTVLGVDGTWFGGSCLGSLFCSCCRILVDASGIWRFYWAGHPRWVLTPLQLRLTWGAQLVLSSRASSHGLSTWLR